MYDNRGIGAGIAVDLGRRGASVVVNHASEKSAGMAAEVVKMIIAEGGKAVVVQADVVSTAGIDKLVQAAINLSPDGKIHILVHNAGHGDDRYLQDIDEDFYAVQTSINLKGQFSRGTSCSEERLKRRV